MKKRTQEHSLRQIAVRDLMVLEGIQRTPTQARVKKLHDNWDEAKVGFLQVAELADGPYAGKFHITNGGTRFRAKQDEPDYLFWCVLTAPMTMVQAAEAFHAYNNLSKRPNPYENYRVGLFADTPYCVAIERATKAIGLDVSESSTRSAIGSVTACQRIVETAKAKALADGTITGDPNDPAVEDAAWQFGSDRLRDVLVLTREMYVKGTSEDHRAHDADLIQAVARIWDLNPGKLGNGARSRFISKASLRSVPEWRYLAQQHEKMHSLSYGGSESRAISIARLMCEAHNKLLRNREQSREWLDGPRDAKRRS